MAVRCCLLHLCAGDAAIRAGLVFNNNGLPERLGQRLADDACDDVRRRTGTERHHQLDRLARKGLRMRWQGRGGRGGSA